MDYRVSFYAARVNAAIGIIAAVLAGAGLTAHPTWLNPDVAATAGVLSAVSLGLAAILPQVQRTPAAREQNYLAATQGVLPPDLADKHPEVVSPIAPTTISPPTPPPAATVP